MANKSEQIKILVSIPDGEVRDSFFLKSREYVWSGWAVWNGTRTQSSTVKKNWRRN